MPNAHGELSQEGAGGFSCISSVLQLSTDLPEFEPELWQRLRGALRLDSTWTSILVAVAFPGLALLFWLTAAISANNFEPMPGIVSQSQDLTFFYQTVITGPLTLFYFLWLPSRLRTGVHCLLNSVVLDKSDPQLFQSDLSKLRDFVSLRGIWAPAFWLTVGGTTIYVLTVIRSAASTYSTWWTVDSRSATLLYVWMIVNWSIHGVTVARFLGLGLWLGRLPRSLRLAVYPWHADGMGGWRSAGDLAVLSGWYWAISGAAATMSALATGQALEQQFTLVITPAVVLAVATYLLLGALSLWVLLAGAHEGMAHAKADALRELQAGLVQSIVTARQDYKVEGFAALSKVAEYYAAAPEWPFARAQAVKVLGGMIISLLSTGLARLFKA